MDRASLQAKIDAIRWYHEFDFGDGLKAKDNTPEAPSHRRLWSWIEEQLRAVPFEGKSVLDIGCWDGYWSFYAEKRGAASVLATDDFSQNWADGQGIYLAKEMLLSKIEIAPRLSVYNLAKLKRKFDVILFLGVYYHLWDPFHALAQIRHCCHPNTVVLLEGNVDRNLPGASCYLTTSVKTSKFTPSISGLTELLAATYFRAVSASTFADAEAPTPPAPSAAAPGRLGWRWRLGMCLQALKGSRAGIRQQAEAILPPAAPPPAVLPRDFQRIFMSAVPLAGKNDKHRYRPPFGLHIYDSRFGEEPDQRGRRKVRRRRPVTETWARFPSLK